MNAEIRPVLTLTFVMALAALAPPLQADWSENFTGGGVTLPWITVDDSGNFPADATDFNTSAENLQLIADFAKQQQNIFDQFAVAIVGLQEPEYSFTDVVVKGTVFAATGHNFAGAVARGNNDSFVLARMNNAGNSGYVLSLDFGTGALDLVRADNAPAGIIGLEGVDVPGFDPALEYVIELTVEGSALTGRALRNGVELASVTTDDSTYASGYSGVGGAINGNVDPPGLTTVAVGFDDISSTAIVHPIIFDITGDGRVTSDDVARFVVNLGKPNAATFLDGDFDVDGRVTVYDLNLLNTQIESAAPAAIPEPATWVAGLCALAVVLFSRRVRAKRALA